MQKARTHFLHLVERYFSVFQTYAEDVSHKTAINGIGIKANQRKCLEIKPNITLAFFKKRQGNLEFDRGNELAALAEIPKFTSVLHDYVLVPMCFACCAQNQLSDITLAFF